MMAGMLPWIIGVGVFFVVVGIICCGRFLHKKLLPQKYKKGAAAEGEQEEHIDEGVVEEQTRMITEDREFTGGHGLTLIDSGVVLDVSEETTKLGVRMGWQIITIDGEPFSLRLLREKKTSNTPYTLTFQYPKEIEKDDPEGVLASRRSRGWRTSAEHDEAGNEI